MNILPAIPPDSAVDPSVYLAVQVKSYGNISFPPKAYKQESVVTREVVVAYDSNLFIQKCNPASKEYDATIQLDVYADELFKDGEAWAKRDGLLDTALEDIARVQGFAVTKQATLIHCNRRGAAETKRDFIAGPLAAGCNFHVKFKALSKDRSARPNNGWQYLNLWDAPIEIVSKCCVHSGGCEPGHTNRVVAMQRAGNYVSKMPCHPLFTLCNFYETSGSLTASLIKQVLRPTWPSGKNITRHDVFNVRVRVRRMLPVFRQTNGHYADFKSVANSNDLLLGIDDIPTIDDDEAYHLAQDMWQEIDDHNGNRDDNIFSFIDYLQLIKSKAKGFAYKLARDHNGDDNGKLVGVIWQTATMRKNFELFGGYICLDMMKRGINKLLWPYTAVAMYDEERRVCLACEGFLCGERFDMYQFACQFLSDNSPNRTLSQVHLVAGDGFFDQNMIVKFGFVNAKYVSDRWHLLESGLLKKFGKSCHDLLRSHLMRMIMATSEQIFEDTLHSAGALLAAQPIRNGEWTASLDQFANDRETYAQYCLDRIPGNRELHGSTASESNHSSVLTYLNDGNKSRNAYCESPVKLIRDLLKRQKIHTQSINNQLFGDTQKMKLELSRLNCLLHTAENQILRQAAASLCLSSYELFKTRLCGQCCKYQISIVQDDDGEILCYNVKSIEHQDAPSWKLCSTTSFRCNCRNRIAHQEMCVHEIKVFGFKKSFFEPRHMLRECVSGSLGGWIAPDTTAIDDILQYENEPINDEDFWEIDEMDVDRQDGIEFSLDMDSRNETDYVEQPAGHLRSLTGRITPLNQGQFSDKMQSYIARYSRLEQSKKFAVEALLLELDKVFLSEEPTKEQLSLKSRNNVSIECPGTIAICQQPKKRLKSLREIAGEASKKQIDNYTQASGLQQTISGEGESILVNGKVGSVKHCQFCNGDHNYTSGCRKRENLSARTRETMLRNTHTDQEDSLRERILTTMPVSNGPTARDGGVFQSLPQEHHRANFVIHEASIVEGMPLDQFSGMIFRVSILGKDAEVLAGYCRIWISGSVMNRLITVNNKKKIKFVFDETITHREGWITRRLAGQLPLQQMMPELPSVSTDGGDS